MQRSHWVWRNLIRRRRVGRKSSVKIIVNARGLSPLRYHLFKGWGQRLQRSYRKALSRLLSEYLRFYTPSRNDLATGVIACMGSLLQNKTLAHDFGSELYSQSSEHFK